MAGATAGAPGDAQVGVVGSQREAGAATGMSETGKSNVIQALAARGYKAVDTDDGWREPLPDGRQRWARGRHRPAPGHRSRRRAVRRRCEENLARFHPQFDVIILFSAPAEVLVERLVSRTGR